MADPLSVGDCMAITAGSLQLPASRTWLEVASVLAWQLGRQGWGHEPTPMHDVEPGLVSIHEWLTCNHEERNVEIHITAENGDGDFSYQVELHETTDVIDVGRGDPAMTYTTYRGIDSTMDNAARVAYEQMLR